MTAASRRLCVVGVAVLAVWSAVARAAEPTPAPTLAAEPPPPAAPAPPATLPPPADPALVVAVIQATGDDPVAAEAASRLGAELTAAGLRASLVDCAPLFDPLCPAPADPGDAPGAVVAIIRAAGGAVIEVKVTADRARSVLVRRMEISPERGGDDPSVLAIRAVELLRATLMQQRAEARPAPPPAPTTVKKKPVDTEEPETPVLAFPAPKSPPRDWGLSAGPALLQSVDRFGSAFGAEARLAFRPYLSLGFEAKLAVLAFSPDLTAPAGRASLQQQLGDLGATYALTSARRWIPTLSASVGIYHVQVTGHSAIPAQGLTSVLWAAQLDVGAGLTVLVGASYALRFNAAAIFAQPSPYVTIGASDAFHAGRPLLLFSLNLERGFPGGATAKYQ